MEIDKFLELIKPYEFQIETLKRELAEANKSVEFYLDRLDKIEELNKDLPGFRAISGGCSYNLISKNHEPKSKR